MEEDRAPQAPDSCVALDPENAHWACFDGTEMIVTVYNTPT